MARYWYAYVGGLIGDPRLSANYSITTVKPSCLAGKNVCAIYAPSGDISPSTPLSINLLIYLSNSKVSGVAEPQQPGSKKYVYLID